VMTNGFGAMPDYSAQIQPDDRWKIAAYIRALQYSQHASLADVPADQRDNIKAAGLVGGESAPKEASSSIPQEKTEAQNPEAAGEHPKYPGEPKQPVTNPK